LAWEVWERTAAAGVACNLITGQEMTLMADARHVASTIEMADMNRIYDVAVIDEMQMIGDKHRGSAWTAAFLGLAARELHVCGDPSMLQLVKEMAAVTDDYVEVHEYKRLTPLAVAPPLKNEFSDIERLTIVIFLFVVELSDSLMSNK
jgi:ATP-dependent RNA helicase SUPV3L1/SUV3